MQPSLHRVDRRFRIRLSHEGFRPISYMAQSLMSLFHMVFDMEQGPNIKEAKVSWFHTGPE